MNVTSFLISTLSIASVFSSADAYVASPRKVIQRYLGIDGVVEEMNKIQEQLSKLKEALKGISALKDVNTNWDEIKSSKGLKFLPVMDKQ